MTLKKKALENTVGNGENAGNQHVLLTVFSSLSKREIIFLATFNLSSAHAFNFVMSKILSCGKELRHLYDLFIEICWKKSKGRTIKFQ